MSDQVQTTSPQPPAESAFRPIGTATAAGKIKVLSAAVAATAKSAMAILPLVVVIGGMGHLVMSWGGQMMVKMGHFEGQSALFASELTKMAVAILWFTFAKPLVDATAIYSWRKISRGESVQAGKAWNWAIGRYKRMLGPHAAKFITVSLGLIIVVPGVLFGLQYAFVHAISATDDQATGVLSRSQRFTKGRRGRIALVWLPYALVWYPVYSIVATYQAAAWGWWAEFGLGMLDVLFLTIMTMVLYSMYEERVYDARQAKARREIKSKD